MGHYYPSGGRNPFLERPVPAPPPPVRNIFISSFHENRREVDAFIYHWATLQRVFNPKALCSFDNDDFIDSSDPEYVMGQIRKKYLLDSTITMVLIGTCTHSRRYVDWELKSSLRRGENYTPNGLVGFLLPSALPQAILPDRFAANWRQDRNCYASYRYIPDKTEEMRRIIEDAQSARLTRAHLIQNDAQMMKYNGVCKVCRFTH
jgi:hypothetical protein